MTPLDKLYLDLRDGVINQETFDKAIEVYKKIPQVERDRYDT